MNIYNIPAAFKRALKDFRPYLTSTLRQTWTFFIYFFFNSDSTEDYMREIRWTMSKTRGWPVEAKLKNKSRQTD